MAFRYLSLRSKILGLCLFLAAVSVAIAAISLRALNETAASYERVTEVGMPNVNALNTMYLTFQSIRISLRTLGLPGLEKTQADATVTEVNRLIAAHEAQDVDYLKFEPLPGEKAIRDEVQSAWMSFKEIGGRALRAHATNDSEGRALLLTIFLVDCPRAAAAYDAAISRLKEFQLARAKDAVVAAKSRSESANRPVLITAIVGIFTGLAAGFFFARSVSRSISDITGQLSSTSRELRGSAGTIDRSAAEMAAAATEQAASIEETAAALEEISAMIAKATDGATAAARSSAESQTMAESGNRAVDEMLHSMNEISESNVAIMEQVTRGNEQMASIVTVIQEISNKTKVINEIVFQTKLLSFNASVEAARAGEHGKGFAVVAEEVGNLARMSGNAAKEISDMLAASVGKVNEIIHASKTGVTGLIVTGKEKVDDGIRVAGQCSGALKEIVANVTVAAGLAAEISKACSEQSTGVQEITKAMARLDSITQLNASSSHATARASRTLSEQSEALLGNVRSLAATVRGEAAASAASVASRAPSASPALAVESTPSDVTSRSSGCREKVAA